MKYREKERERKKERVGEEGSNFKKKAFFFYFTGSVDPYFRQLILEHIQK